MNLLKKMVHQYERILIERYLADYKYNQSKTAKALGIHRNTLLNKMALLEIRRYPCGDKN